MSLEFELNNYSQAQETAIEVRARDEARRKCIESSARELQREGDTRELGFESEVVSIAANMIRGGMKE